MGTELALKLVDDHELTVWNRTAEKAEPLVSRGATAASTPTEAVEGAELVITCLFGPDIVREVVIEPGLIPDGVTWADATTISPADAAAFADAVPGYVHTPVVGSLPPARAGKLGVYAGGADASRRSKVADVVAPWAAANPERLKEVDTAAGAATGKLLANLALAVTIEGFKEALLLGEPFMAEAALEVGLVNRVVPPSEANALAQAQARKLAAKPLSSLIANHAIADAQPSRNLAEAVYRAASIERVCKLAYDVLLTGLKPSEMKWSDMVGMKSSLIERAADVYWAGAARMTIKSDPSVLQ